nr:PREDICTED: probable palmitoyltransferase ZDHHC16 isoform X1 [Lepisosteus oculatus]XP_015201879.1 PREDICTED: probable palmitoyltransferase ZDHHC16 isoform X1 [Lepisosteus oculatus]
MRSRARLFAGAMRLFLRWCRLCPRRSRSKLLKRPRELWSYGRLILRSLYFNSLTNSDVIMDSLFEPVYWLVDHLTRWFGVVFVFLVVVLTSSVLLIIYLSLLPLALTTYSLPWIVWHIVYGHWNLVMIVFHYYKATRTSPGYPPQIKHDIPSVSVCKKCITPKPARTHHCSICNRCILKMDHHCPWLNNCVGHFNHRYFFSFCLFMTMGCVYCSISCRNMFFDAYSAIERMKSLDSERHGVAVTEVGLIFSILPLGFVSGQTYYQTPPPPFTFRERMFHKSIIYLWVLTSSVALALGGLTLWHAVLISRGETSIERHINRKEARRLEKRHKVFRNPFNYGRMNNWKLFFGVEKKSHWLTRVLLPSGHSPYGDGLTWDYAPYRNSLVSI